MISYLTREESEQLLTNLALGHLGCNDGFNTYVYPVNYIFNGKYLLCQSLMGAKIEVMRRNTKVCFQVDTIKSSNNWKSVMVLGEYQEIDNERERFDAIKAFVDRKLYPKISETMLIADSSMEPGTVQTGKSNRSVIYRVIPMEIIGRAETE
jgi:uncharacterized protein